MQHTFQLITKTRYTIKQTGSGYSVSHFADTDAQSVNMLKEVNFPFLVSVNQYLIADQLKELGETKDNIRAVGKAILAAYEDIRLTEK